MANPGAAAGARRARRRPAGVPRPVHLDRDAGAPGNAGGGQGTRCAVRRVRHQPDRTAWRGGSVESHVTLGGRQVGLPRRRVRDAEGEVPIIVRQAVVARDYGARTSPSVAITHLVPGWNRTVTRRPRRAGLPLQRTPRPRFRRGTPTEVPARRCAGTVACGAIIRLTGSGWPA